MKPDTYLVGFDYGKPSATRSTPLETDSFLIPLREKVKEAWRGISVLWMLHSSPTLRARLNNATDVGIVQMGVSSLPFVGDTTIGIACSSGSDCGYRATNRDTQRSGTGSNPGR